MSNRIVLIRLEWPCLPQFYWTVLELDMPRIEPFEEHSDSYEKWFEENADLYQAELEAVRGLLPPAGAEGMEVGVGTGRFAGSLGIKMGVEPSGQMAARARVRGIDVYPGVAEGLPFPDGRFDFILFVTTICFVDDLLKAFEEAFRTLKAGFEISKIRQTIVPGESPRTVLEGFGRGGFVVVQAVRGEPL